MDDQIDFIILFIEALKYKTIDVSVELKDNWSQAKCCGLAFGKDR